MTTHLPRAAAPTLCCLLALMITSCGSTTSPYGARFTRYTWDWTGSDSTPEPSHLQITSAACLKEVNASYTPGLFGGGKAIQETLYKDCVERHGYRKVKSEHLPFPDEWNEAVKAFRPTTPQMLAPLCGGATVTCIH
jgi:hypothetical protein